MQREIGMIGRKTSESRCDTAKGRRKHQIERLPDSCEPPAEIMTAAHCCHELAGAHGPTGQDGSSVDLLERVRNSFQGPVGCRMGTGLQKIDLSRNQPVLRLD